MLDKKNNEDDLTFEIDEFDYDSYQLDTAMFPDAGLTISLGPIDEYNPPAQQELFRSYIMGQWLHDSHLADENPQWQCEAYIEQKPFLKEANEQKKLELTFSDTNVEYWYAGSKEEFLMWRLRWSEYFDDPRTINWK